jgi:hypothetical protein
MRKINVVTLFLFVLLINYSETKAQGNLIIIPRRVVFEGPKRIQELNLANTSKDTAKFLISVIQYRMKDDGAFENITQPDSGQYFADKNFRFFPRSVILAPNEAQTIKVQLINTGDLKAGEYRSHLYFRSVPNVTPLGDDPKKEVKTISVHLIPIFGIAIPIIIRIGTSASSVILSNPAVETKPGEMPQLKLAFCRVGNASVYGDIKVDHISPQGKITQVGLAKGFAIYTPNQGRHFTINLDNTQNVNFHKGKLHIVYNSPSDTKSLKIAETELALL